MTEGQPPGSGSSPYFFLSYVHTPARDGDDPDRWVYQLYKDLCDDIIAISAASLDAVGFMDREMKPGALWQGRLAEALATCRVFVPLYSPRYFTSEWCGREWYAFSRRQLEHTARSGTAAEAIIPALWASVDPASLPEAAGRVQFDHRAFGARYSREGFYGIMKLGRYRAEYKQAVFRLAKKIVEVAEGSVISPLPIQDFGSLPCSFGSSSTSNLSRQRIRITVAAPSLQTAPAGRELHYYGATAREWKPFQPEASLPLADYAAQLASSIGFQPSISTLDDDLSEFKSAGVPSSPGLFLVDAWGTLDSAERQRLQEYDEHAAPWVSVMVPWNTRDTETVGAEQQLKQSLRTSLGGLLRRVPPNYSKAGNGIPTLGEFGDLFPWLAYHVGAKYLKYAKAHPPAGPAPARPKLVGPVPDDSGGSA